MLTNEQIQRLKDLRRDLTAMAPIADEEYRLVASGFRSKPEAEKALLQTFLPLMSKVDTARFGLCARPMFGPVPKGSASRRTSGWGVFVRDREVSTRMGVLSGQPEREAVTQ